MASSNVIGIPTDEKVFEENCIPLFAGLLKGTSKNGDFGVMHGA